MGDEPKHLHVVLFPFMAHGHMIPTLDIARLFAARDGVKTTIITTPLNAPTFTKAIENSNSNSSGLPIINLEIFNFPAQEAGLPEGCENLEQALEPGTMNKFFSAAAMLRHQLEVYLDKARPHCLVADMFFTWATDSAAKYNIPRLMFHGHCYFSLCVAEIIRLYEPYKNVSSNDETFRLPCLPHEIELTRSQLSGDLLKDEETAYKKRNFGIKLEELKCFGVIVNSFYELEPEYADYFRNVLGRKSWHIGPVSICRIIDEKTRARKQNSIDEHECLKWLNTKRPNSVIYICFGSTIHMIAPQLKEIAMALESCTKNFIWVVGKEDDLGGYERGLEQTGLIIRGWVPQVMILDHEAIGAFVTHCGWNSTLEGISAGVPMVTWPMFAEQFYNEKLVTKVLRIGVGVGAKRYTTVPSIEDLVPGNAIEKALREIMEGDEAEERRSRAKEFKEKAWKALEENGSSYLELSLLINELRGLLSN